MSHFKPYLYSVLVLHYWFELQSTTSSLNYNVDDCVKRLEIAEYQIYSRIRRNKNVLFPSLMRRSTIYQVGRSSAFIVLHESINKMLEFQSRVVLSSESS